jgi:hypothetical protein
VRGRPLGGGVGGIPNFRFIPLGEVLGRLNIEEAAAAGAAAGAAGDRSSVWLAAPRRLTLAMEEAALARRAEEQRRAAQRRAEVLEQQARELRMRQRGHRVGKGHKAPSLDTGGDSVAELMRKQEPKKEPKKEPPARAAADMAEHDRTRIGRKAVAVLLGSSSGPGGDDSERRAHDARAQHDLSYATDTARGRVRGGTMMMGTGQPKEPRRPRPPPPPLRPAPPAAPVSKFGADARGGGWGTAPRSPPRRPAQRPPSPPPPPPRRHVGGFSTQRRAFFRQHVPEVQLTRAQLHQAAWRQRHVHGTQRARARATAAVEGAVDYTAAVQQQEELVGGSRVAPPTVVLAPASPPTGRSSAGRTGAVARAPEQRGSTLPADQAPAVLRQQGEGEAPGQRHEPEGPVHPGAEAEDDDDEILCPVIDGAPASTGTVRPPRFAGRGRLVSQALPAAHDTPRSRQHDACYHCREMGHWKVDCPYLHLPAASASASAAAHRDISSDIWCASPCRAVIGGCGSSSPSHGTMHAAVSVAAITAECQAIGKRSARSCCAALRRHARCLAVPPTCVTTAGTPGHDGPVCVQCGDRCRSDMAHSCAAADDGVHRQPGHWKKDCPLLKLSHEQAVATAIAQAWTKEEELQEADADAAGDDGAVAVATVEEVEVAEAVPVAEEQQHEEEAREEGGGDRSGTWSPLLGFVSPRWQQHRRPASGEQQTPAEEEEEEQVKTAGGGEAAEGRLVLPKLSGGRAVAARAAAIRHSGHGPDGFGTHRQRAESVSLLADGCVHVPT